MADENQSFWVTISANIQGLVQGLQGAGQAVTQSATQMNATLGGLSSGLGAVGGALAGIAAIAAGGALLKGAVDATMKWNGEAMKLARTLGITTQEASILNLALGDIYTDAETYTRAVGMMTRQLNSGGEAFEKLGIKTKDANGNLKPSTALMGEAIEKLNGLKAGTDRNAAGMALFGRGWMEASKLLKLNAQVMEEARQKAERLHLVVGPEGVEKTKAYKAAMNDMDDVLTSLKVQIGSAVLPALTKLGAFMGDIGPGLALTLSYAIKGVVQTFLLLKAVVETLTIILTATISALIEGWSTVGRIIVAVAKGNIGEAVQIAKEGARAIKNEFEAAAEGIATSWKNFAKDSKELWTDKTPPAKSKAEEPDARFDPGKGDDKESDKLLRKFKEQLEQKKAEESNWFTWSTARELEFWEQKLGSLKQGTKAYVAVLGEVNKLRKEKQKEEIEAEIETLKFRMDLVRNDGTARLALQEQVIAEEVKLHGKGSKEVIAAEREKAKILREIEAETTALKIQAAKHETDLGLMAVQADEERLQFRKRMGQVSAEEEYATLADLENRKTALKMAALDAQLQDENLTREQRRELLNQEENLEMEHQQRLREIQHQAQLEQREDLQNFLQPLTSAFSQSLQGILSGTMSWSNAMRNVWRSLGQMMDQAITRMVMSWLMGERTKTAGTQAGVIQRVAVETWGAIKSVALAVWTGIKWIAIQGYKAAAGAYSAISSIPYVGPFLAPVVAAGVLASVIALGSKMASASGGWERVPSDQIAMIHKDEQVLPASYAQGLRDLINGGGQPGGQQKAGDQFSVAIQALDSKSFEDALRRNQGGLVKVIKDAARNGRMA